MVTLMVSSFLDADVDMRVMLENNIYDMFQTIRSHEEFSTKVPLIKQCLAEKKKSNVKVQLVGTQPPLPWWTSEEGRKIGRLLKTLQSQVRISLYLETPRPPRSNVPFRYFLEEITPIIRKLSCETSELRRFQGISVEVLETWVPFHQRKGRCYLSAMLGVNALNYICEKTVYLHQFFQSRLPSQSRCKSFSCWIMMNIVMPENFYENIFQEMAETLPKLKSLKLTCDFLVNMDKDPDCFSTLRSHIIQIANHSHVPTVVSIKVIERYGAMLCQTRELLLDILKQNDEIITNSQTVRASDKMLIHTQGKAKFFIDCIEDYEDPVYHVEDA